MEFLFLENETLKFKKEKNILIDTQFSALFYSKINFFLKRRKKKLINYTY